MDAVVYASYKQVVDLCGLFVNRQDLDHLFSGCLNINPIINLIPYIATKRRVTSYYEAPSLLLNGHRNRLIATHTNVDSPKEHMPFIQLNSKLKGTPTRRVFIHIRLWICQGGLRCLCKRLYAGGRLKFRQRRSLKVYTYPLY